MMEDRERDDELTILSAKLNHSKMTSGVGKVKSLISATRDLKR